MKFNRLIVSFGFLFLLANCQTHDVRQSKIMDEIERSISLPAEASEIDSYAKYYADKKDGTIDVVFMIPFGSPSPTDTCSEFLEDGSLKDVDCPDIKYEYPILSAGARVWMEDYRTLPIVDDGGCSFIEIKYVPSTKEFSSIRCNGGF